MYGGLTKTLDFLRLFLFTLSFFRLGFVFVFFGNNPPIKRHFACRHGNIFSGLKGMTEARSVSDIFGKSMSVTMLEAKGIGDSRVFAGNVGLFHNV